jgi:hypothetical protein
MIERDSDTSGKSAIEVHAWWPAKSAWAGFAAGVETCVEDVIAVLLRTFEQRRTKLETILASNSRSPVSERRGLSKPADADHA